MGIDGSMASAELPLSVEDDSGLDFDEVVRVSHLIPAVRSARRPHALY